MGDGGEENDIKASLGLKMQKVGPSVVRAMVKAMEELLNPVFRMMEVLLWLQWLNLLLGPWMARRELFSRSSSLSAAGQDPVLALAHSDASAWRRLSISRLTPPLFRCGHFFFKQIISLPEKIKALNEMQSSGLTDFGQPCVQLK